MIFNSVIRFLVDIFCFSYFGIFCPWVGFSMGLVTELLHSLKLKIQEKSSRYHPWAICNHTFNQKTQVTTPESLTKDIWAFDGFKSFRAKDKKISHLLVYLHKEQRLTSGFNEISVSIWLPLLFAREMYLRKKNEF